MRNRILLSLAGLLVLLSFIRLIPTAYSADYWAKTYGGADLDEANSIQQTSDGGYIIAGITGQNFSDMDAGDVWISRLNADGTANWQKTYGGTNFDKAMSIQQTADGGYIVAGFTRSSGAGSSDAWILKLNSDGAVNWQKTYGGASSDGASSIQQTADGGYIVAGFTLSSGVGGGDAWVIKLDSTGIVTWQKTYGGADLDDANSIRQTADGGYIVAGFTRSSGAGGGDAWILKLNSTGIVIWQKTYGGVDFDDANSIQQTSDGGYIVAGFTGQRIFFGDTEAGDAWILKLSADGTVNWQKTYGGTSLDEASSIQQTSDGGYIVTGTLDFFTVVWISKLNADGTVDWEKVYDAVVSSGTFTHPRTCIQQTSDGGYIVAAYIVAGPQDIFVLRLDSNGDIGSCGLIAPTSVIVIATSVSGVDTSVTPVDTFVSDITSSLTETDSFLTVGTQCPEETSPVPDIKVNGSDEPITPTDNLLTTVALDSGSLSDDNADWWVVADTPYGWFYLVASTMSWEFAGTSYTDLLVTHQGALFNLSTIEVLNIPVAGLLPGTYTFYFAVDTNMNGLLDLGELFYDSVVVNITP